MGFEVGQEGPESKGPLREKDGTGSHREGTPFCLEWVPVHLMGSTKIRREKSAGTMHLCCAWKCSHFSLTSLVMDRGIPLSKCYREMVLVRHLTILYGFISFQVPQYHSSTPETSEGRHFPPFIMLPSTGHLETLRQRLRFSRKLCLDLIVVGVQDGLKNKQKKHFFY